MNQIVYEQFDLDLGKSLLMLDYLVNESRSSLSLKLTIKQAKLKHINVFVNKFVNTRLGWSIYNIWLHVYIYKNIRI